MKVTEVAFTTLAILVSYCLAGIIKEEKDDYIIREIPIKFGSRRHQEHPEIHKKYEVDIDEDYHDSSEDYNQEYKPQMISRHKGSKFGRILDSHDPPYGKGYRRPKPISSPLEYLSEYDPEHAVEPEYIPDIYYDNPRERKRPLGRLPKYNKNQKNSRYIPVQYDDDSKEKEHEDHPQPVIKSSPKRPPTRPSTCNEELESCDCS